jgi:triosephosphate isomerase
MKRKLIAGNWKMYKTQQETVAFMDQLNLDQWPGDKVDAVICPSYLAIPVLAANQRLIENRIFLGAQDGHPTKEGAYTGAISMNMVLAAGCRYVIVGHSERRQLFGETDIQVRDKVLQALSVGLVPILCVGETKAQRDSGETETVIRFQISEALADIKAVAPEVLVIAYEPVWAIGTGTPATAADAMIVNTLIRDEVVKLGVCRDVAALRILYGGSVKPDNIGIFLQEQGIDGALVGGASLDPLQFREMVDHAAGMVT